MVDARPVLIDESDNEARCHKSSMASAAVRHVRKLGYSHLTAGSCGNYGLALAVGSRGSGLTAVICIPWRYSSPQTQAIKNVGADVMRCGETYEDAVAYSRQLAVARAWADCNPDGPFEAVLVKGLAARIEYRLLALAQSPDVLWLPLGNGTTALAALTALDRLNSTCRVIAVTSLGNNSVLSSWRQGSHVPLAPQNLRETHVNEPLCNWDAAHGPALLAKSDYRLSVVGVSDHDLVRAAGVLERVRQVRYTPSGSAGYAGYSRYAGSCSGAGPHAILLTARELTETAMS